jgi:hypothetical protein
LGRRENGENVYRKEDVCFPRNKMQVNGVCAGRMGGTVMDDIGGCGE